MEQQVEAWELRSGTWLRDRTDGTWRLSATRDRTAVASGLPRHDVARLVGASRDERSGEWFPPEFNYSPRTGAPLPVTLPTLDSPWTPPFGAPALARPKPVAHGLRQTPLPLALARGPERMAGDPPDRRLPPLPAGQYRFVVDKFGLARPVLVAVEPERAQILVLLPESNRWIALERSAGAGWGQRLPNPRSWRMEIVHSSGKAMAYCASAGGLAAINLNVMGLSYAVEHAGEGPAVGGPVAWAGKIWSPVLGEGRRVLLVGRTHGADRHIILPTRAPVPRQGFEAPVYDGQHVNWACNEGQLVLKLDADNDKQCEWIGWPDGTTPLFEMGSPYLSPTGTFWQLCRRAQDGRFEYVRMGRAEAETVPIDSPRLCTGRASYNGTVRSAGDPWSAAQPQQASTGIVVVPLLESTHDGAVIGLRMKAPHGLPALLQSRDEARRVVLQFEVPGGPPVSFGTVVLKRPWLAMLFVYEGHLWLDHADLPQPVGWELSL